MAVGELPVLGDFRDSPVDTLLERDEGFGHSRVEGYHGRGAVGLGAYGAELEAVAGEGEGRGAVAVGIVDEELGNLGNVHFQSLLAGHGQDVGHIGMLYMVEQLAHLLSEERGDDGGRRLVGAQSVGVGGAHDAGLEQAVVPPHTHQCLHNEGGEAQVGLRRLAGSMEEHAVVGG